MWVLSSRDIAPPRMSPLPDTTVLNNFDQIRRPNRLRGAWPDLAAPIPVWNELELGVRGRERSWTGCRKEGSPVAGQLEQAGSVVGKAVSRSPDVSSS